MTFEERIQHKKNVTNRKFLVETLQMLEHYGIDVAAMLLLDETTYEDMQAGRRYLTRTQYERLKELRKP